MPKTWSWPFAIRLALALIPALVFCITPLELWGSLTAPEDYPFGAESPAAAMWAYKSQRNYLVWCAVSWLASGIAIRALLVKRARLLSRGLWSAPFLIAWALTALDGTRLVS
ncbi:hypothetical protein P3T32_000588 [Ralstonia sp. GP73]|jgi:hypothetical protein|uniref:Transmembrane protein n=2 Tax=Burkholderiaceae TaxID=119060 RepID=A0AAD2BLU8_9RALS|nr:hypothetical protein [Ralstonia sp. GP73]CAJ0707807.1 hypothetical protein LMG7143_00528 [Ralstonia sp. LMG 18095]CAJ0778173.1 hypothetical protein LMG18095_00392 [Ralstonia sp. LMG 18095]CAJ0779310.1 hypothetical protein R77560_00517 [Ralstonia sp. LMG 18095]CAJ0863385.1 hypothetical protein R6138_01000 [Ralstonia sp. LMG 18095]